MIRSFFVMLMARLFLTAAPGVERALEFAPAPVGNPLKGLVPYAGRGGERFPHSMEFSYVALSDLVTSEKTYRWEPVEGLLDAISGRGHQAILRVYVEYPKKPSALPTYLVESGVKVFPDTGTPDYTDARLRQCLTDFIAAFGAQYDGDPRLGFLTAGLLGKWGEWHTYPEAARWAPRALQEAVLDAYEKAFTKTPVLLRYPIGAQHPADAPNTDRPFGYHDDSFAWGTLDTGRKDDSWFFIPSLRAAGPNAVDKWKTRPIGGEIRPEAWGKVFDQNPGDPRIQNFALCVRETHVTWLMDSGMFGNEPADAARRARAGEAVRAMGYTFHIPGIRWSRKGTLLEAAVRIENRGVAPFYAPWPLEWALLDDRGKVLQTQSTDTDLTRILPGEPAAERTVGIDLAGLPAGSHHLALRVANPLPHGAPVRFANATQDQHASGWLTLVEIELD